MTYVKTYTLMDAWAQTFPRTPDAPCAVCSEPIPSNEVCYYVTQLERDEDGHERPVCWRHVRPDNGPLAVSETQSDCACGQPVDVEGDVDADGSRTVYVEDVGFWHRACWDQFKADTAASADLVVATEGVSE